MDQGGADDDGSEGQVVGLSPVERMVRIADVSVGDGSRGIARRLWDRGAPGPIDADAVETFVAQLGALKGVPMQIGQLLSVAPVRLPDHVRRRLERLSVATQGMPFEQVRKILCAELSTRATELLENLDQRPWRVGAIGQVHRGRLADGTPVDVKIQYPGIAVAIGRDLAPAALLGQVSAWFDRSGHRGELVREIRERLLEECDYHREAKRRQEFQALFRDDTAVRIPRCLEGYCTGRVLTSERTGGLSLADFLASRPSQESRDRAGRALFDFYFGGLFRHGVYNWDAYPANLRFTGSGEVTILDHGGTSRLTRRAVQGLAALSVAVDMDEASAIHRALVQLGFVDQDQSYDREYTGRMLRWFFAPTLVDEDGAFAADLPVTLEGLRAHRAGLRGVGIPGELLFVLPMRLGLGAVLARLGARANWCARQRALVDDGRQFDVVLRTSGDQKIEVVRALRGALGISVREAKELLDAAPCVLTSVGSEASAHRLLRRLRAAGAGVEVSERAGATRAGVCA